MASVTLLPDVLINGQPAKSLVRFDHPDTGNVVHVVTTVIAERYVGALRLWWEGSAMVTDPLTEMPQGLVFHDRSDFGLDLVLRHAKYLLVSGTSTQPGHVPPLQDGLSLQRYFTRVFPDRQEQFLPLYDAAMVATDRMFLPGLITGPEAAGAMIEAYQAIGQAVPGVLTGSTPSLQIWSRMTRRQFDASKRHQPQRELVAYMVFLALAHRVDL